MSNGLHPALQARVDASRRDSLLPPTPAPFGLGELRARLHLPRRRHRH